jgi:hypothetical protein
MTRRARSCPLYLEPLEDRQVLSGGIAPGAPAHPAETYHTANYQEYAQASPAQAAPSSSQEYRAAGASRPYAETAPGPASRAAASSYETDSTYSAAETYAATAGATNAAAAAPAVSRQEAAAAAAALAPTGPASVHPAGAPAVAAPPAAVPAAEPATPPAAPAQAPAPGVATRAVAPLLAALARQVAPALPGVLVARVEPNDEAPRAPEQDGPPDGANLSAGATAVLLQPAPLLASAVPFDLGALERGADAFFARLGELDGPLTAGQVARLLAPWLVAGVLATAAVEVVHWQRATPSPGRHRAPALPPREEP